MSIAALARLLQDNDYSTTIMPDGSGVLMDLRKETLLTFNESAATMLAGIEAGHDEQAIVGELVREFAVDEPTARADLDVFVGELAKALGVEPDDT